MLTLILVTALAFLAFSIIPGDPTSAILGTEATPEQIATLRAQLKLDRPLVIRYLSWVLDFIRGDMGMSYDYERPVSELLASRLEVTLTLSIMAFLFIVIISIPVGIFCARYDGGPVDRVFTVLNQITMSIPNFLMAMLVSVIFGLVLKWFVPAGYKGPENGLGQYLEYLFFPALAVGLPRSAMTVKMLRGSILDEMGSDYLRTAYSKGNSKTSALWRHVLRNAMIPVVTFLTMTVADIVAGSIVVEQVFAVPGLGQMLITSIGNRDYPVVQAIVVLIACVVVSCNFTADILYRVMDPRLRG